MDRRAFIAGTLGLLAVPLVAHGQHSSRLPTIGFLGTNSAASWADWVTSFVDRLRELGWVDGRTVRIEYRWADGRDDRMAAIAAELARLKVDVIVTSGAAVTAIKNVTSEIPVVFALANDPVGTGMVASLARPGGNVTGLSLQMPDLAGKRLELLRETVRGVRRLAVLANMSYAGARAEMQEVEATSHRLGLGLVRLEVRRAEDIGPAFKALNHRADALYVCTDPLVNTNRVRINTLALAARLPTLESQRQYVEAGGLMSYGPNVFDLFRRSAEFVDKILRGARPADLPVEQPTKFELVINLRTARALGLTIPPSVLARADEIIR